MPNASGQTGGTAADYAAQIDQLFLQYEGRHATADELATLGQQLAGGSRSVAALRADMVASADGQAYLPGAISQAYQTWGGRAATPAEVAVWENEMTIHGATLATVRQAVVLDPLGAGYTTSVVTQAYQTAFGRAPTVGELAAWQDQFLAGIAQPSAVAMAVQANVQLATIDAQVIQAYQTLGGRAPTDAELATWRDTMLNHGGTLARLKADIVADPLGTTYLNGQVAQAYQQYMGRAPTTGELATWHDTFAAGGAITQLKNDILADGGAVAYATTELQALFASHGWGTPTADNVAAVMAGLRAGQSFADAAAAVPAPVTTPPVTTPPVTPPPVTTPPGAPVDPGVLTAVYDSYAGALGRAPSEAEARAAATTVQADGTGADLLRASLLAGAEGQAYTAAHVTAAYQMVLGHAPGTDDLANAVAQITAGNSTFDTIVVGLLDTDDGHAQAGAVVAALYARVLDRAPTADELADGVAGLTTGGRSVLGVDAGLFASAEGQVHFSDQLNALYGELMNHAPSQDETATWFDALYAGADYTMVRAALMVDPTSTANHLVGTVGADTFALGASPGDVVISAFDPQHDKVVLAAGLAGTNLLDAAHATQVMSLDDVTPNVLIRLSDHDSLLLHGVTLAQLSGGDFQFG